MILNTDIVLWTVSFLILVGFIGWIFYINKTLSKDQVEDLQEK